MPTIPLTSGYGHDTDKWYHGTIDTIETTTGQYGDGLKWIIMLDGEPDRETWAYSSQTLSPRSKLHKWTAAILGAVPDDGLNTDDLIGRRVSVMFELRPGHDAEGQPVEKERVALIKKGPDAPKETPAADDDLDAPF